VPLDCFGDGAFYLVHMSSLADQPPARQLVPFAPEYRLFGQAIVKTGQKHKDRGMIRLGRLHMKVAAGEQAAKEPQK
jgi:hypothetical protein